MSWQDEYKNRLASAEEAVAIVDDGDRVVVPLTEQPLTLIRALADRASEIEGATLTVAVPQFDVGPFLEAGWDVEIENFIGPYGRPYEHKGMAPYSPLAFSLTFKAADERPAESKPIDVALVTVAHPNKHGQIGFGPQSWYKRGIAQRARKVAAQVNPSLVRTFGDGFMPVAGFDKLVEVESLGGNREDLIGATACLPEDRRTALLEIIGQVSPRRLVPIAPQFGNVNLDRLRAQLGIDEPSDESKAIAENVRLLIADGSTIQIGVGKAVLVPAQAGRFRRQVGSGASLGADRPGSR